MIRRFFRLFGAVAALAFATPLMAAEVVVAAREAGYYTSLARHLQRWLDNEAVAAELVPGKDLATALASAKIAFLVGYDSPSAAELAVLKAFRARGGRLAVFYSSSPELARMMGVKPRGYAKAGSPGQWSSMAFTAAAPPGCPRRILQTSTVLQRAQPAGAHSRVIAYWCDRSGKNTGEPAWIESSAGWWMTHVLLADGDEKLKARLAAAMVGAVLPARWNLRDSLARAADEHRRTQQLARAEQLRPGEIHAVWEQSGCGLYPGDWPRTLRVLSASGVTDLFLNVGGVGFANYPSKILPASKILREEGDQLAACLKAAQGTGIRVHAWFYCFNATRASAATLQDFERKGWRLRNREGRLTEYLDPSNAELRQHLLDAIGELTVKYRIDGVHLDFVRWYERSAKPADAALAVSRFVAAARLRVAKPRWLTVAVLGKYPSCVASVGQDWTSWLHANCVDYVVPMDYTDDNGVFESYVRQHAQFKSHAWKTIVGIGVTANESRLDARQVLEQLRIARRYRMAGVALFDLDTTLEKNVLPYLRLGAW